MVRIGGGFTNKVILIGRLTKDPDVYRNGDSTTAKFTLAVDRRFKRENDSAADFISCVSFGKSAEFSEKYLKKGTKIAIEGRIQTGSYTNREGQKVYTTDVVVESQEFAESKGSGGNSTPQAGNNAMPPQAPQAPQQPYQQMPQQPQYQQQMPPQQNYQQPYQQNGGGFMQVPPGVNEEVPFV